MSNYFKFDITDDSDIEQSFELAFRKNHKGASGWAEIDGALVFAWGNVSGSDNPFTPLPVRIDGKTAAEMAKAWLETQDYGTNPPWDGTHTKGYRLYNESYGHAGGHFQGFAAIKPHWIVYGK